MFLESVVNMNRGFLKSRAEINFACVLLHQNECFMGRIMFVGDIASFCFSCKLIAFFFVDRSCRCERHK